MMQLPSLRSKKSVNGKHFAHLSFCCGKPVVFSDCELLENTHAKFNKQRTIISELTQLDDMSAYIHHFSFEDFG